MERVRREGLVEDLGESKLAQEPQEQRQVVDTFVSQVKGGVHGRSPTTI